MIIFLLTEECQKVIVFNMVDLISYLSIARYSVD